MTIFEGLKPMKKTNRFDNIYCNPCAQTTKHELAKTVEGLVCTCVKCGAEKRSVKRK